MQAVQALIETPQNNFKLYWRGALAVAGALVSVEQRCHQRKCV